MASEGRVIHTYPRLRTINRKFTNKNLNLEEYFVQLEILKLDNVSREETSRETVDPAYSKRDRSSFPGRNMKNTGRFVDICNIIGLDDQKEPPYTRILLLGSPGTGKSTGCQKIAYEMDKSHSLASQFKTVNCVQLRTLENRIPLGKFLKSLQDEGCDTLYILDGYDEIQSWLYEKKSDSLENLLESLKYLRNSKVDIDERNDIANVVQDYFTVGRDGCSQKNFILTTRPNVKLDFKRFDTVLEIRGFSKLNAIRYIHYVLKEDKMQHYENEIIEYINSSAVSDMVTIPLFLDAILYTWDDLKEIKKSEITMTKLYEVLVDSLGNKRQSSEKDILAKIGYKWLREEKFYWEFYLKNFVASDVIETFKQSPFLNAIDTGKDCEANHQRFELIHLTLLEFFAAYYLVNTLLTENEKEFRDIVQNKQYCSFYNVVFRFVAGLINSHIVNSSCYDSKNEWKRRLDIFLDCLEGPPIIDLVGFYHFSLIFDCIHECELNVDEKRIKSISLEIFEAGVLFTDFNYAPKLYVEMAVKSHFEAFNCLDRDCTVLEFSDDLVSFIMDSDHSKSQKLVLLCRPSITSSFCLRQIEELLQQGAISKQDGFKYYQLKTVPLVVVEHIVKCSKDIKDNDIYECLISDIQNVTAAKVSKCFKEFVDCFDEHEISKNAHAEPETTATWKLLLRMVTCKDFKMPLFSLLKNIFEFMEEMPSVLEYVLDNNNKCDEELYTRVLLLLEICGVCTPKIIQQLVELFQRIFRHDLKVGEDLEVLCFTYLQNTRKKLPIELSHLMIQYMVDRNRSRKTTLVRSQPYINFNDIYKCFISDIHNVTAVNNIMFKLFTELVDCFEEHKISKNAQAVPDTTATWKLCVRMVTCGDIPLNFFNPLKTIPDFTDELPSVLEFVLENKNELEEELCKRLLFFMRIFNISYSEKITQNLMQRLQSADVSQMFKMSCLQHLADSKNYSEKKLPQKVSDFVSEFTADKVPFSVRTTGALDSVKNGIFKKEATSLLGFGAPPTSIAMYIRDGHLWEGLERIESNLPTQLRKNYIEYFTTGLNPQRPKQDLICRGFRLNVRKEFWKADLDVESECRVGTRVRVKDLKFSPTKVDAICMLANYKIENCEIEKIGPYSITIRRNRKGHPQAVANRTTEKSNNLLLKFLLDKLVFLYQSSPSFETYTVTISPLHLDMSGSKITDQQCIYDISPFIRDHEVHSLVLSNNQITEKGFVCLIRSVARKSTLKYLLLDRNYIYFDKCHFDAIFSKEDCHLEKSKCLVIDLSFNFILLPERDTKISALHDSTIIYERSWEVSFRPLYFDIVSQVVRDYDAKRDSVEINKPCVFYAAAKGNFGYSSHVLIIMERIEKGQRILETAELFNVNGFCQIEYKTVNPNCYKFKKRLENYSVSAPAYPSCTSLDEMLQEIKKSAKVSGLKTYGVEHDGVVLNCVDWANDMLKYLVGSDILKVSVPMGYALFQRTRGIFSYYY